jgi:hypothetical protein
MVAHAPRSFRRLLQGGLPFSLRRTLARRPGLCCSRPPKRAPLWTVRTYDRPFPRFHVAPCSVQLGLSSVLRQRPSCAANLAQPFVVILLLMFRSRSKRFALLFQGSAAGIRTPTCASKVRCSTIKLLPNVPAAECRGLAIAVRAKQPQIF